MFTMKSRALCLATGSMKTFLVSVKWFSIERRDWVLVLASTSGDIVKQTKPESESNKTKLPIRRNE